MSNLTQDEVCKQFWLDPYKNPRSGRRINPNSTNGIYDKLVAECGDPLADTTYSTENYRLNLSKDQVCDMFFNNPRVDPRTGFAIDKYGPIYNKLVEECKMDPLQIYDIVLSPAAYSQNTLLQHKRNVSDYSNTA